MLARLGIRTVGDLLCHIPRRYEDRTTFRSLADLVPGEPALVRGRVRSAEEVVTAKRGLRLVRVVICDEDGAAELVFYNQPYLLRRFQDIMRRSRSVIVYGTVRLPSYGLPNIEHPEWEEDQPQTDTLSGGRIVPVYNLCEGLTQSRLRRMTAAALSTYLDAVDDVLPDAVRVRHRLKTAAEAFRQVHYPERMEEASEARRRLVFEEFLLLQLAFARLRSDWGRTTTAHVVPTPPGFLDELSAELFPFALTGSQRQAITEIAADMASGRAMNRLLHGDVGSGKTAVAVAAVMLAVRAGMQAAIMAPTEVLAQQHASVFVEWFSRAGVEVQLLVGGMANGVRNALRQRLENGALKVVVGTHALIEEDVRFARLGLVVVDEQHRFGVLQRKALQSKGEMPHVLVMSATPIPRTLTLTLYGDLDVSCLRDMPPGRKPVRTYWKTRDRAGKVYDGVRKLLEQGRQAYMVCPLVETSEKTEAAAATQHAERIRTQVLPGFRVGLLHGQMSIQEKNAVMAAFKAHDLDVLVSTTVIEVGVDVSNAAVMVIEDADRFGLAQLHQLRGRVGRGEHTSYCILIADPATDEARRRLEIMTETTDGFRIAEEDLRLRGPGEFYGTKQSGLPTFRFGDILRDEETLIEARKEAERIVASDPSLGEPEHQRLRQVVAAKLRELELVTVS